MTVDPSRRGGGTGDIKAGGVTFTIEPSSLPAKPLLRGMPEASA